MRLNAGVSPNEEDLESTAGLVTGISLVRTPVEGTIYHMFLSFFCVVFRHQAPFSGFKFSVILAVANFMNVKSNK